ncbi:MULTISPECIES: glycine-rich domain-containing protein [Brucella/Ochrobactrum group]|jgi:hypothetical protein|nr:MULTISPECIES: hypothetical protein [Brucella/Ochrobactrum group]KAB2683427.1 hypothetical protein F9K78_06630 [Brucella pseudintermedia]MCO7728280.1 hypothetical protein [Brucella intermedia]NKE74057.1 hypothetical protein [Ochrobactrum sp. MC-1LL]TWH03558.1 hypothetical protein L614_001200001390 [Ochrobactrum sp. J50]WPM82059.1 hypothetical protein R5W60_20115 [Brucella pseudintermedia]
MNLEDFNSIELKKIATDGDHALVTKKTSAEVVDIVTKSMSFPMEAIIKRYRKEHNIDLKTASLHERELKRFLALAAIYDVPLGMRGPVDELWHTFIIFTVDYMNFCQTVAGRMIHHVPTRDDEPIAFGKKSATLFDEAYRSVFSCEPPSEIWPQNNTNSDCQHECRPIDCYPCESKLS